MRIKKEYYEEDQAAKQNYINETERAMKQQATQSADYGTFKVT